MMDKETYLKELHRYFNSVRNSEYELELENIVDCYGVSCEDCIFNNKGSEDCIFNLQHIFDAIEILEKWIKENPPKHKVSKMEYDVLKIYISNNVMDYVEESNFENFCFLNELIEKGYFEGADGMTNICEYFDNCEVCVDE